MGFDIGHHVTFVSFRFPSFLAWLGVPFIWGPVAGGEQVPRRFYSAFGVSGGAQEALRDLSNVVARFDPLVRFTARRAAAVVAATNETACRLPSPAREKQSYCPRSELT